MASISSGSNCLRIQGKAIALGLALAGLLAVGSTSAEQLPDEKAAILVMNVPEKNRDTALEKLAFKLKKQSQELLHGNKSVTESNFEKLRPALQRHRSYLLSKKVLSVDPNSENVLGSSAGISNEIVGSIRSVEPTEAPQSPLVRFHSNLKSLQHSSKAKQVTILHLAPAGDGAKEFAQALREEFHTKYGDAGHGLVSPVRTDLQVNVNDFEVTHTGRWRTEDYRLRNRTGFGLTGLRMTSRSSYSTMSFESQSGEFDWAGVTIATGPSQGAFTLKIGDVEQRFDAYSKIPGSKLYKLDVRGTKATVIPGGGAKTGILSWHTGRTGVGVRYVDLQLAKIRSNEMAKYQETLIRNDLSHLAPDLIIIDRTSGAADEAASKQLDALVAQVRAVAPGAELLHLGRDSASIAGIQNNCKSTLSPLDGIQFQSAKPASVAQWNWSPNAFDMCSNVKKVVRLGADNKFSESVDLITMRANALLKWLTGPANPSRSLVQK